MNLEDLRIGANVISSDGHKLGTLSKFVVREAALKLTHVVVDTGILRSGEPLWKGGWGLSHDRIVPLAALAGAASDRIDLTMTADAFREHSLDYEEEYFAAMPDLDPGGLDLGDVARIASSIPGEPGPWIMLERRALAPGETEIPKDAPVWRLNPHTKIGEVDRVVFDDTNGSVVELVIRRGFLFTKDVALPAQHIVEIIAGIVRVDIDDDTLSALKEFEAPD
jgi:sporulation protein YlmC with PRC-barrel domain